MNFGQIVDLSLAGYNREQITAIGALNDPKAVELALSVKNFDEFNALAGMADNQAESDPPNEPAPTKPAASAEPVKEQNATPAEDEKQKEIETLKTQLAAAQAANASKDLSGGKDAGEKAMDQLADIFNNL